MSLFSEWKSTIVPLNLLICYLHTYVVISPKYVLTAHLSIRSKSVTIVKECIPLICRYNQSSVFAFIGVYILACWMESSGCGLFDLSGNFVWTSKAFSPCLSPAKRKLLWFSFCFFVSLKLLITTLVQYIIRNIQVGWRHALKTLI